VKHAELDIGRQSPRAQQAAQFLRDAAPPESVDRGLELAGVLSQLQADDDLLLAGLLVPCIASLDAQEARVDAVFGDPTVRLVRELEREMKEAAARLDFERAAALRDRVRGLKSLELAVGVGGAQEREARVAPAPGPPRPVRGGRARARRRG